MRDRRAVDCEDELSSQPGTEFMDNYVMTTVVVMIDRADADYEEEVSSQLARNKWIIIL